ncbi:MAG: acyltransferase, partial [Pseudomonadota bacterium]|nr:acyltransferase [Pseudomonadota bacterium]
LIRRTEASVVPVFFEGQNSLPYQVASHVSNALRIALIFHEVRRRVGSSLDVVIGEPLDFFAPEPHMPPANLARMLQRHTHDLAGVLEKA